MNYKQTPEYFQIPTNYFWQWADHNSVIEWKNGDTICYTDDLLQMMRSLSDSGVAPLGVMLLALAACNDSWKKDADCTGILHGLIKAIPQAEGGSDDDVLSYHINRAIAFMDIIAQLPAEVRKGYRRAHLLHEIINEESIILKGADVIDAIDDLVYVQKQLNLWYALTKEITRSQFISDLTCLTKALEKYPTAQGLEIHLRTGLTAIPLPAPIELPEQKPADLLQELLEEPKTTGISRLAKKIIAALNIPMHLQRSGGQSYGGISDITNRGNFDRLLLSELANDDTVLMTRLVNNEALYLRREEPPHNPKTKRVLLIDSTLKLWGVPRVFAVSAAIACTQNIHHHETIEAYTLGGHDFTRTDLTTKPGILQSLQQLDPSLHCTTALSECLKGVFGGSQTDCIFITSEETVHDISFQKWLASSGDALGFIITVNRNGTLHFNSLVNGHLKQLTAAKFDLDELLFKGIESNQYKAASKELPAFCKIRPSPLLFPSVNTKFYPHNSIIHDRFGLIGITESWRLLHWSVKGKGAKELIPFIEPASCSFGFNGDEIVYLLANTNVGNDVILYTINIRTAAVNTVKIKIERSEQNHAVYEVSEKFFYLKVSAGLNYNVAIIDCENSALKNYSNFERAAYAFRDKSKENNNYWEILKKSKIDKHGYNVFTRINNIYIDTTFKLCLENKYVSVPGGYDKHISFKQGSGERLSTASKPDDPFTLPENPKVLLSKFAWPDGSTATVDSRGLLHLKSSDTNLPEVTMVLIQGKTTACWASDDTLCGSEYFRESIIRMMPVDFFYTKYITPIIQHILQS